MQHSIPADADARRSAKPVVCYEVGALREAPIVTYQQARQRATRRDTITVPPRQARCFDVPAGHFFRIVSVEGPQVGDLNLWHKPDLSEHFYSGKTRQLHATHLSTGDHLWSTLPGLRPMATIIDDTLAWYGFDDDGAGVHDVIGTRCDPYTNHLLRAEDYNHCCHSNLTRALSEARNMPLGQAEGYVHDVLNVFMCTGFTHDTHQYFMKASPVRPGDYLEFIAQIDLLAGLSACPGGDCASSHSDDVSACYPLRVEIFEPEPDFLATFTASRPSAYAGAHGAHDEV